MLSNEVFIVDDDYDMREALAAIFRYEGYRTAAFTDGRSFVRLARGQTPACVLLDLCMPGMSGDSMFSRNSMPGTIRRPS